FGWTLAASAALLVPPGTWDLVEEHRNARRARTVVYDADCGVCLWLSRLLRRLDLRGNLTFQGNDDLGGLNLRTTTRAMARADSPAGFTADLVSRTVVVVDTGSTMGLRPAEPGSAPYPGGGVHTRARGVAEVVQALPLGWLVAWAIKLPGIVVLLGVLYD